MTRPHIIAAWPRDRIHCARPCTSGAGCGSPMTKACGRLKSGFFHRTLCLVSVSMAARTGKPSGLPVPLSRSSKPVLGRHPRMEAGAAVVATDKGADTMAGFSLGTAAPTPPAPGATQRRTLYRVPTTTRTRRLHGVCLVGDSLLSVFSTRTAGAAGRAVTLTVQTSASERTLNLAAADCRVLARFLVLAADAAELGTVAAGLKGGAA